MLKIVIAEDEQWVMSGIRSLLAWEFENTEIVGEAEDGEEALQLCHEHMPDLLITDIRMPKLSGIDVLKRIRETLVSTEVIIVTGYDDFEYVQEALRLGAADYLLKPIDSDDFTKAVRKIMDKKILQEKNEQLKSKWYVACQSAAAKIADWIWENNETALNEEVNSFINRWFSESEEPSLITERFQCFFALLHVELQKISGIPWETEPLTMNHACTHERLIRLFHLQISECLDRARKERNWGYSKIIREVCEYLENHYADSEISLSTVSERYGMSPAYLSQIFKQVTGQSFIRYLTNIRMKHAKKMLKDPQMKLYEIGEKVGFGDYPHFSKVFKKYNGESPSEYRKMMGL